MAKSKCPQLRDSYGYQMHHSQLLAALGLPVSHKYGREETWSKFAPDGTELTLYSSAEAIKIAGHANRPHRLFAKCGHCGKSVPAGRLHQHYKAH